MKLQSDETQANEPAGIPMPLAAMRFVAMLGVLIVGFAWADWETFASLEKTWSRRPVYSHGYFVVPFAIWLFWQRMRQSRWKIGKPHVFGVFLLAGAFALRWLGATYFYNSVTAISILPAIAGMVIAAGGFAALRWSWPAIVVLAFMIPLPYLLETALQEPLRTVGTGASVYVMQSAGLDVVAEGNVIVSGEMRIGVEEACSGLSMLLTFLFLSTAVILVSRRSYLESAIILLSAVPIALVSNILRITSVGVLYKIDQPGLAEFLHEYAAFLMMPAALGMLWIETAVLSRLIIDEVQRPIGLIWDQTYLAGGTAPVRRLPPPGGDSVRRDNTRPTRDALTQGAREETKSWRVKTATAPH